MMESREPKQNMAPEGAVKFASPQWTGLFYHALARENASGIQVNINNDAGWCGSGGPWITPEQSMKKVVSTSEVVTGPSHVDLTLATPETVEGFYRDIALFAIPQADTLPAAAPPQHQPAQFSSLTT